MMDKLFLQKTYADNVGGRLERFKVQQHTPYRANFRCPICGDSATNKFKKRGFILEKNGSLMFHCHNECGTMSFESFLNNYYSDLYTMYKFELIKYWKEEQQDGRRKQNDQRDIIDSQGDRNSGQQENHYDLNLPFACDIEVARQYIEQRQLPKQFYDEIYYADKFYKFVNEYIQDKFPDEYLEKEDRRIVLPLRDYGGEIFGVIGRSLDSDNNAKYLTIKFDEEKPKLFGLNRLDKTKFVYVFEGPIDSLFVDNSIAFAGTDGTPDLVLPNKSNYAIVLDNQPRSVSVLKKYQKYIDQGYKMVIWPENIVGKDINQLIVDGMSQQQIYQMLLNNTYGGVKLKIMFNQWRKL